MSPAPPPIAARARPWADIRAAIRALPIAVLLALSIQPSFASESKAEADPKTKPIDTVDGTQYFRLDPFVVPILGREAVARHFTMILTIELTEDSGRNSVREKLPLLRHALNTALLQMIGTPRTDGSLPPIASVKRRLVEVTRDVTGQETVRDVLLEAVYERKLR